MAPASSERKPVTEARHILVVDDDRRIRELIRSYLMENDFLVSVAGTAAEARERMRGVTFDLMVLDIMMPGETGLDGGALWGFSTQCAARRASPEWRPGAADLG